MAKAAAQFPAKEFVVNDQKAQEIENQVQKAEQKDEAEPEVVGSSLVDDQNKE